MRGKSYSSTGDPRVREFVANFRTHLILYTYTYIQIIHAFFNIITRSRHKITSLNTRRRRLLDPRARVLTFDLQISRAHGRSKHRLEDAYTLRRDGTIVARCRVCALLVYFVQTSSLVINSAYVLGENNRPTNPVAEPVIYIQLQYIIRFFGCQNSEPGQVW